MLLLLLFGRRFGEGGCGSFGGVAGFGGAGGRLILGVIREYRESGFALLKGKGLGRAW